jgi:Cu/Ag efflux protein CusF
MKNRMKVRMKVHSFVSALALGLAGPALAQTPAPADPHAGHHAALASTAAPSKAEDALSEGEIRKVDKEAQKLIIRHGEIPSVGMGPMTMVFGVKNAAMLQGLKAGDKVRFAVEKTAAGYVVTDIRSAP